MVGSSTPISGTPTSRRAVTPPRSAALSRNRVPPVATGEAVSSPSCASTSSRQIDRPSPSPVGFEVTKGWNSRPAISGAIPGPVSATAISTAPGRACVDTVSSRVLLASIASTALRTRLMITWPIWMRSSIATDRQIQRDRYSHPAMLRADQPEFHCLAHDSVDVLEADAWCRAWRRVRAAAGSPRRRAWSAGGSARRCRARDPDRRSWPPAPGRAHRHSCPPP